MPNQSGSGSLSMHLMWLPVQPGEMWNGGIDLEGLIRLIYKVIYGRETGDPLLINILNVLSGKN
jgi:hypothetical protein